jgi:amino acid permease
MCFFGTVVYAVLLRDMLEPITHVIYHKATTGPTWEGNSVMLAVVLLVTPLCTLKTLTALKRFGAASMFSVLILGCCVLFRSLQCNLGHVSSDWKDAFRLFPKSWKDLLDAFPLYISTFVCHYNILTVHNELRRPSEKRVSWWLRSTTWSATLFYLVLGFSGSAYSKCTADGTIQGNILLDFDDSDPLLLVGRMCLAITITLAFPMLTIPARDIVLRSLLERQQQQQRRAITTDSTVELLDNPQDRLGEPLLSESVPEQLEENEPGQDSVVPQARQEDIAAAGGGPLKVSLGKRLGIAIMLFWTATAVACCVASIDIVWDLLGSSLSIILSFLIPCGSYIVIMRKKSSSSEGTNLLPSILAGLILAVMVPMMFVSTANAVYSTFFEKA